jgi:hypothetical protein
MSEEKEIPEINLKLEEKTVEGKIITIPYIIVDAPYVIYCDKDGTRKIWTKNKWKIVLWYLYRITRITWFIKKYNRTPR